MVFRWLNASHKSPFIILPLLKTTIDEGFGSLDEINLDSMMATFEKLKDIIEHSECCVGIGSHCDEQEKGITVKKREKKEREGRSAVEIKTF